MRSGVVEAHRLEELMTTFLGGVRNMLRDQGFAEAELETHFWPMRDRVGIRPTVLVTGWSMRALRSAYYSFRNYPWTSARETVTVRLMNARLDAELAGNASLAVFSSRGSLLNSLDSDYVERTGELPFALEDAP